MNGTPAQATALAVLKDWKTHLEWTHGSQGPVPTDPGGLPPGWNILATLSDYAPMAVLPDRTITADMLLVRAQDPASNLDAWLLLSYIQDSKGLLIKLCMPSPYDLVFACEELRSDGAAYYGRIAAWLRSVVMIAFDQTDPDEAADCLIFALDGPVDVPPRSMR